MIPRESAFFQRSIAVAKSFVRSVVLVDDRAYELLPEPGDTVAAPVSPDDAVLGKDEFALEEQGGEGGADAGDAGPGDDRAHAFDVRAITRLFAKNDLLATVAPIEAGEREESLDVVVRLARRADVLVLDWALTGESGDRGAFAQEVLRHVREDDQKGGGRLRLVVIYTGDNDRFAIKQSVCDALGIDPQERDAAHVTEGHARYVVLGKPSAQSGDDIAYENLPARIVSEFAELTAGLLSNVALRGFAALRDMTHAVLAQTDRALDAPYLAHRVHCAPAAAAEDLAVELLVDECASILRNADLQEEVAAIAVRDRVAAISGRELLLSVPTDGGQRQEKLDAADADALFSNGYKGFRGGPLKKLSAKKHGEWEDAFHEDATRAFGDRLAVGGDSLNERFSVFTSMVNVRVPAPSLTLGVLLRRSSSSDVLLCLQPRCDAVRVPPSGRDFLFTRVEPSASLGFDLVVRSGGDFVRGLVRPTLKNLRLICFPGGQPHTQVRAVADGGRRVFRDVANHEYEFLGQLKDGHAQRYANEFAAQVARVGVDTFEWLRRSDRSRR